MNKPVIVGPNTTENDWEESFLNDKSEDIEIICKAYKDLNENHYDDTNLHESGYFIRRHFSEWPFRKADIQRIISTMNSIDSNARFSKELEKFEENFSTFIHEVLIGPSSIIIFCANTQNAVVCQNLIDAFRDGIHLVPSEKIDQYIFHVRQLSYYEIN